MLKINDLEFDVGVEVIQAIASSLPDKPAYSSLIELLASHPAASVRSTIAYKENLNESIAILLSKDKDLDVLRNVTNNSKFRKIASEEDVIRLIAVGDSTLCKNISYNIESYENCDPASLAKILCEHSDPGIRYTLAQNYGTPKRVLKILLDDGDPDVRASAARDP